MTIELQRQEYSNDAHEKTRDYLRSFPHATHAQAYSRLLMLANGAEPASYETGICWEVDHVISEGSGYAYCSSLFCMMNLDCDPLPYFNLLNKWEGEHGAARRDLCRQMADMIRREYL